MGCTAFCGNVTEHFAHEGRELKAVAGEACADDDMRVDGVSINDEVSVGGEGVKAAASADEWACGVRNVGASEVVDAFSPGQAWRIVYVFGASTVSQP